MKRTLLGVLIALFVGGSLAWAQPTGPYRFPQPVIFDGGTASGIPGYNYAMQVNGPATLSGTVTASGGMTVPAGQTFTMNGTWAGTNAPLSAAANIAFTGNNTFAGTSGFNGAVTIGANSTISSGVTVTATGATISGGTVNATTLQQGGTAALLNSGANIASGGYQLLSSGLQIEWGTLGTCGANSSCGVTFSQAMPTATFVVLCSWNGPGTAATNACGATSLSTTGFTLQNTAGNSESAFWIALGH